MNVPYTAPVDLDTVLDDILAVRDTYSRGLNGEGTSCEAICTVYVRQLTSGCSAEPNAADGSRTFVDMAHRHANVELELAEGLFIYCAWGI